MRHLFSLIAAVTMLSPSHLRGADQRIVPVPVQRKTALVIGNSEYRSAPLRNPANDATLMAGALRQLGFGVTVLREATRSQMAEAFNEFASGLRRDDLALFYFSGHGTQVNGENYLLPVDFSSSSESAVADYSISLRRVQSQLQQSVGFHLIVIDACRNNPFQYGRGQSRGLAAMDSSAPNTLLALATSPGEVAYDSSTQPNGLFTVALVSSLLSPGQDIEGVFRTAQRRVHYESQGKQIPYIVSTVIGRYSLYPSSSVRPVSPADEAWTYIKDSQDPKVFALFLKSFPDSRYAAAARSRVAELERPVPVGTQPSSVRVSKDGLRYVWIPPGQFVMGCSSGDSECFADEKPPRKVSVTKGFWISNTEVSQQAYERVTGTNPSRVKGGHLPVDLVSWYDSRTYCQHEGGRLPTEAEWEYAARGGSMAGRFGAIADIAWYSENSGNRPHEVGNKMPNAFGLYDILGNVWEWVADWYVESYPQAITVDPSGPASGSERVLRGGSFASKVTSVRPSFRASDNPEAKHEGYGFRCVMEQ